MLSILSPAPDRSLLSVDDMLAAVSLSATQTQAQLSAFALQVSDAIALACAVPGDGVTPPTLLSERVEEVLFVEPGSKWLCLARRFITDIESLTIAGEALDLDDALIDKAAGRIRRLDAAGSPVDWPSGLARCTYTAGFSEPPPALKMAAQTMLAEGWSARDRDPLLRAESIEGVGQVQFYEGGAGARLGMSQAARDLLAPFTYQAIA